MRPGNPVIKGFAISGAFQADRLLQELVFQTPQLPNAGINGAAPTLAEDRACGWGGSEEVDELVWAGLSDELSYSLPQGIRVGGGAGQESGHEHVAGCGSGAGIGELARAGPRDAVDSLNKHSVLMFARLVRIGLGDGDARTYCLFDVDDGNASACEA
jgi:hypothetical protein